MKNYLVINAKSISGYAVKEAMFQEKKHLVVPVVMIVEGVLNGSHGPLLHTAEEFGKFPDSWNGIPAVINHPEKNGIPVSANDPEVLETYAVGVVFNTQANSTQLSAEIWLDEEKLGKVSNDTLVAVNKKKPIEVSVGVFTDDDPEEGEYDGIKYNAIARNHRPDHLALLPGAVGACSLEDGCGVRANKGKNKENVEVTLETAIQTLKESGLRVYSIVDNSEKGLVEKLDQLRDLVRSLNVYPTDGSSSEWNYLIEVYDSYLVYEKEGTGTTKYFKQNFAFNASTGAAEFVGEPAEVVKKVEYDVVTNKRIRTNFGKEKVNMCTPCVERKVNELIANKDSGFVETDRDMLQALSEAQLDKLVPKTIEVNKAVELSAADKAALDFGKAQLAERRAGFISTIQANTSKELWPDATLNEMNDDMLEKMSKSFVKEEGTDFSLNGNQGSLGANARTKKGVAPLLPAGIELK